MNLFQQIGIVTLLFGLGLGFGVGICWRKEVKYREKEILELHEKITNFTKFMDHHDLWILWKRWREDNLA